MDEESLHVRYLIVIAVLLCAVIIGYNAFYVPNVSLSGVTVATDVSSLLSSEEYIPQSPSGAFSQSQVSQSVKTATGKININTATVEQLSSGLDGIGEVMAKRIVDYREKNGRFKTIEELKNVAGIGDKTFLKIRNSITVE